MEKTAFLFSGQGSQYPGMGVELAERSAGAAKVFADASEVFGFDVLALCRDGSEAELAVTRVSQPVIFTTSLAALAVAKEEGFSAEGVAGHSLGEYAAMVAAGMVSFTDGCRLIAARADAMQKCAERQKGGMVAVLGQGADAVEALCDEADGYVVPVNYNSPVQTVVAGNEAGIASLRALCAERKIKAIPLAVSAAFHSALMQSAADAFLPEAAKVTFAPPRLAFYANLYGKRLPERVDMPHYLAAHLTSPVRFTSELAAMAEDGFTRFIELGPGKVLTGLVKKTLKGSAAYHIEDNKSLEQLLAAKE